MKKVLFFTYDFPYPITSGGKNRAYHMLKYASSDVELHLFSFIRPGFKEIYKEELKKIGVKNSTLFERPAAKKIQILKKVIQKPQQSIFKSLYYSPAIDKILEEYLKVNEISILHAESFYTGFYLSKQKQMQGIKQIYGSENVEYVLYKEYVENSVSLLQKPLYTYQVKMIMKEEKKMSDIADMCLAVSQEDKQKLSNITKTPIKIVDNGIDTKKIQLVKKTSSNKILFVGNFSYFPNIKAIEDFYREVFIKTPNATLVIVGKDARSKLSFINDERVEAYDFVEDLAQVYQNACVFVFPIRFGGGTNFKVLEAMAYGVPLVAFPDKITNIEGISDKDYFPVDTFEEMKNILTSILKGKLDVSNPILQARKIVEKNYSWEKIGLNLSKIWQNL